MKIQSIQTHPSTHAIVTLERMRNSRDMARTPYTTSILTMALRKNRKTRPYTQGLIHHTCFPTTLSSPSPTSRYARHGHGHGLNFKLNHITMPFFATFLFHTKGREKIETPYTCIGHQEAPEMGAWSAAARSLPVLSPPWLQPSFHHKTTISGFSKHPPSHRKGKEKNPPSSAHRRATKARARPARAESAGHTETTPPGPP